MNWHYVNYLSSKAVDGFINRCKYSYNLGATYGLNGVAYGFGQGTTTIAETGIVVYGPAAVTNTINNVKNVVNKIPKTFKGTIYNCNINEIGGYLAKKAPQQVTPGTNQLQGQYINNRGRVEPWTAYYDEYGRLIARTDYNAANITEGIPSTHYHLYEYGPGLNGYEYLSHVPGEYIP